MTKANTVRESTVPEDNRPLAERLLNPLPVHTGFHRTEKEYVHWINGTGDEHSVLLKVATTPKTRQQGFEKAVWSMACDKDGNLLYKGKVTMSDFHNKCDKIMARNYGMLILGFDVDDDDEDGEGQSLFDKEIDAEVKKSKPGSAT